MVRNKIKTFEDLEVWQLGHTLTINTYKITAGFPKSEVYGLISQMRRASSSVAANIVEGYFRNTTKELIQFLYHARGSCGEMINFVILSKDLGYIDNEKYLKMRENYEILIRKITAMINALGRRK